MRLLLFDIDGTLLRVHRGGRAAVREAIVRVTGQSVSTQGVSFSGRTDPAIFRDVLTRNGISVHEDLLADVIRTYSAGARQSIRAANVDRLQGAKSLLSSLARRDDIFLGLVTGNVEPIAFHKLETVSLATHFELGAFGSDHESRLKLPPLAVRRATQQTGRSFSREETVVIGDTPHDVACAQAENVRSVAVSTGHSSHSDLAALAPDLLLKNLRDTDQIVEQLLTI